MTHTDTIHFPSDSDRRTYVRRLDYYLGRGETPEDAEDFAMRDATQGRQESPRIV